MIELGEQGYPAIPDSGGNRGACRAQMYTIGTTAAAGMVARECGFAKTRLDQVAPIGTKLILSHVATHMLRLPKSFR